MPMTPINCAELKKIFEAELHKHLENFQSPNKTLQSALKFSLLGNGKRLRPLLVLSTALALTKDKSAFKWAMPAALAVELIHNYSLVHDDLPAMDNDDYRRGRLSLHRQYDEACAILVGDALLTDAFYCLSLAKNNAAHQCQVLAQACGRQGLVYGQLADLSADKQVCLNNWVAINHAKTGLLFEAACVLGAISVGASKGEQKLCRSFGKLLGQSFQIKDDLDDKQGLFLVEPKAHLINSLNENLNQMHELSEKLAEPYYWQALLDNIFGEMKKEESKC